MRGLLHHPFRVAGRALWLAGELVLAALNFIPRVLARENQSGGELRARWLQHSCVRVLQVFNVKVESRGMVPTTGLLVCNHLSYLDILVLGSLTPSAFVAKLEVKHWPVFGWFARMAGTVFVDRQKRVEVGRVTQEMQSVLGSGVLLTLFPEGTSSDGQTVLAFKSSLLEPAARQAHCLCAGLLRYELEDGDAGEEVCYWKDMTLLPHLINLLSKAKVSASVSFRELRQGNTNRKELARALHSEVLQLKQRFVV